MTKDEIMKLEGRELDAAIAERLFGWKWLEVESSAGGLVRIFRHPELFVYGAWGPKEEPINYYDTLPHYSTDIAAAWLVVEKMQEKRNCLSLTYGIFSGDFVFEWKAEFRMVPKDGIAWADTAPLAICRAALLAVMESE
jgi:hypothetical protein